MKKLLLGLVALGLCGVCVLLAEPPGGGGGDRKGPPRDGPPGGPGDGPRGGPPRFELGHVLPPFVRDQLDLTEEQEKQIADLEKEVKAKLSKILTREQLQKVRTMRPPRGPGGPGGPGGPRDGDRPPPPRGGRPGEGDRPPGGPGDDRPPRDGDRPPPPDDDQAMADKPAAGIQWFAMLQGGLDEAKRTGKPILLVSAAPHCAGVSGIW
jgi:hypothetical protein